MSTTPHDQAAAEAAAPEGTLSDKIAHALAGVRGEIGQVRQRASACGHRVPALANEMTAIMQTCMGALAFLTELETIVAAERMAHGMAGATRQARTEELELFAGAGVSMSPEADRSVRAPLPEQMAGGGVRAPLQRERMVQSLHRAADHTLDDDEEVEA